MIYEITNGIFYNSYFSYIKIKIFVTCNYLKTANFLIKRFPETNIVLKINYLNVYDHKLGIDLSQKSEYVDILALSKSHDFLIIDLNPI